MAVYVCNIMAVNYIWNANIIKWLGTLERAQTHTFLVVGNPAF